MYKKKRVLTITICGLFTAASVVLLLLTSVTGVAMFVGPLLASFSLVPIILEFGSGAALGIYISVALVSLMIIPDREMAIFYILFAWYPIGLPKINKISFRSLRIIVKVLIYSAIIGAFCGLFKLLTGADFMAFGVVAAIFFVSGCFAFLLLDLIYSKIAFLWKSKWRKIFRL